MAIFTKVHKRSGVEWYYVRFILADGRRKVEKAGTTRKQAEKLHKRRLGEVASDSYVDPRTIGSSAGPSFGEFADRFMQDYAALRRSDHYAQNLRPLREFFADRGLRDLTRSDLDLFRVWRARQVGPSTLRKNLTALGTVFKMAVRWGVLEASPAVDLEKPKEPHHKTRFLTRDEWDRLLQASPPWLRPMLRLALCQGLRLKEVTRLQWDEVDRESGVLYVSEDSKTARADSVPLTEEGRGVLAGQVRHVRSRWVFLDAEGESYTSEGARIRISKGAKAAMVAAGIQGASFHTLRHTTASWMVQRGVSLAMVQCFMRHRNTQTTLRYAHLRPEHLGDTVRALDAALSEPEPANQPATHSENRTEPIESSKLSLVETAV